MDKYFIITVDTESDNQWNVASKQTTENAKYIPRFQEMCEKYGFPPTYLVDYSMAKDSFLKNYLITKMAANSCEVGMHLHAWDTPPRNVLDNENTRPYLVEYPLDIMEAKVASIDELISNAFEVKPVSHRAGRWAINEEYIAVLKKYGYRVDCSVTPGINWSRCIGNKKGGADYSKVDYLCKPYLLGTDLLEVPVSIQKIYGRDHFERESSFGSFVKSMIKGIVGRKVWLRPSLCRLQDMIRLVECAEKESPSVLEFMMHSSEFMPGGSPYYKNEEDISYMYEVLDKLFKYLADLGYNGITLSKYRELFVKGELCL